MPAPVDLVTIHHEGAGAPSDVARGAHGGYTYWIGVSRYTHLRSVWTSYATLNFNHVSLDLCLSGNRNDYPVTKTDIELVRMAVADARSRGYVIDAPYVRPHHLSPGSSTVCPGTNTWPAPSTWAAIVTACHKEAPPMPPVVAPEYFPALTIVSSEIFTHPSLGKACVMLDAAGHVYCSPPNAYMGSPYDDKTGQPKPYWGSRKGATVAAAAPNGYIITATSGEKYGPKY